jgi:hypothetical protein
MSSARFSRNRTEERSAKRSKIRYLAPREVILDRLNILGCTPAASQERFEAWLARKRAELSSELSPDPDSAAVETFTFNQWRRRVPRLLATRWRNVRPRDAIERQMREEYGGWLWFDGLGSLLNLRALLDACPRIKTVGLDISELVGGGWIEPGEAICELRRIALATPRPLAPTVLLAEGSQTSGSFNTP